MSIQRFQRLARIRQMQENQSAIGLARRLADLARAERQRDQIGHYLGVYIDAGVPDDAPRLKQLAALRQQLRVALEQQELRVAATLEQSEQARLEWLERHQARRSLEKLIERRQQEAVVLDNRKQQAEQDAWATRYVFQVRESADR